LIEHPPAVIFTTAFDEYAMRAFESHAVDYLLKPFSKDGFEKAVKKWREQHPSQGSAPAELLETAAMSPSQSQRIVVKNGAKIKIIPAHEVLFLEASDDYVKVHTREGSFLKNKTMAYFEKVLDAQQFARSHRSYIVNVQYITRLDQYEKDGHIAILSNGAKVPVSKSGYSKLRTVLGL
ncbi:MAG: response regulator transcription factor, partial [Gemmatimonadaceae bacterium]|nr:response regulator transcription factor [Chitinophagaceae bacterium]